MVDPVIEWLAFDYHASARHVGEIRCTELARVMDLREEQLLGRPRGRSPLAHTALKCT